MNHDFCTKTPVEFYSEAVYKLAGTSLQNARRSAIKSQYNAYHSRDSRYRNKYAGFTWIRARARAPAVSIIFNECGLFDDLAVNNVIRCNCALRRDTRKSPRFHSPHAQRRVPHFHSQENGLFIVRVTIYDGNPPCIGVPRPNASPHARLETRFTAAVLPTS